MKKYNYINFKENKGAIDIMIILPATLGIVGIIITFVIVMYVMNIRHDQFLRARLFPPSSLVKAGGNLRDDCEYILGQAKQYIPLINKYSKEAGKSNNVDLDPALVAAMIQVESGWNPSAVSPAGAGGLMQVMPETAQGIANQLGTQYDPSSAEQNIQFGTYYIAEQLKNFNGDLDLALAAYNGGPGAAASGNLYTETILYGPQVKSWYKDYLKCLEEQGGSIATNSLTKVNNNFPVTNVKKDWNGSYYGTGSRDIGFDINVEPGALAIATEDGYIDPNHYGIGDGWGKNRVWIVTGGNEDFYYAHLDELYVQPGQKVSKGDVLGVINTKTGATVHLHFGIGVGYEYGNPKEQGPGLQWDSKNNIYWIDPADYLNSIK